MGHFYGALTVSEPVEMPKIVIIHFQSFQASARHLDHENVS
jgi:hypothetical protein